MFWNHPFSQSYTEIPFPLYSRYVFFFGDLNYRIDELDIDVVKDYVKESQVPVLLSYDQVT